MYLISRQHQQIVNCLVPTQGKVDFVLSEFDGEGEGRKGEIGKQIHNHYLRDVYGNRHIAHALHNKADRVLVTRWTIRRYRQRAEPLIMVISALTKAMFG